MERIHYAGDSVVTGSAIAHALLEYARALALIEASDTVEIPVVRDDGSVARATMLIGPASQLISESVDDDREELENQALVDDLTRRAAGAGPARPVIDDVDDLGEDRDSTVGTDAI
ncbi:hypothetical protein SCB71_19745 [Herbiconiux sp. KACC 21604]|uniref:hypothetical protein n=1 Tax=unclassified Herbiconiux TaxID=2618217 RepID=UPI001491792C|nr:hypothetical protein [Herbiconiux sp. SALV-R1]QJU55263.1 hypothetical protein HL652_17675 [Herbiconiux sp. SALV-R1]WPO86430.1 hypothetical protein SCB71_19745 [Herbiconiux sp. KACC 21604]